MCKSFQHTAARRRLPTFNEFGVNEEGRFNTQPPEGDCAIGKFDDMHIRRFNTQPPEGDCRR